MMRFRHRKHLLAAGLTCLMSLASAFAQTSKTWNGSVSADWFTPDNWTPAGVPATNDTVNFTNGTINFTRPVTIYSQFNWSGGTLSGSPLTVAASGWLGVSGSGAKYLEDALTNAGTVAWSGSGAWYQISAKANQAAIHNLAGGVFDIQSDSQLTFGGGIQSFNNAGLVRKSAGAAATKISSAFTNSGTVTVLQGTLDLNNGGKIEGTFSAADGAVLNFGGGSFTYGTLPVLEGPGAIQLNGGNLTLLNDVIPHLAMVGGAISLGADFQGGTITNLTLGGVTLDGNHTVSGAFNWAGATVSGSLLVAGGATVNWSAGTAAGALTIATNGSLNLSGSGAKYLENALTNAGTVAWSGSGAWYQINAKANQAAIHNLAGGVFDIQSDSQLTFGGSTQFFNNAGLVRKSAGAGTTSISTAFTNTGSVSVSQGTLALKGGFTETDGTLQCGLSGLSSFGKITVSGPATLGGTVSAVWLGGYVPALSNSFAVITYSSRSGVFTHQDLPPAAAWQTNYSATAFTLTVINISKLKFAVAPSGSLAGAILAPVVVQVQDSNGNPIATNGVPITLALTGGAGPLNGALTQLTDATGKAAFNDLSLNLTGSKTLQASAPASWLTPATASFVVSAAAAAQLAMIAPINSPQLAGSAFSPGPVVQVRDQFGNINSNARATITAHSISSGAGSLGGTTNVNANGSTGSATFSGLRYNLANPGAAESVVVSFSSPGLTSVTNSAVMVDFIFSSITLQDRNSVVEIDPTTERGMFSWTVDGTNQMYQHWFWLRAGTNGAQTSFDELGKPWGLESTSNNAVLNYFAPGMSVQAGFTLVGGVSGSQASDLAETLTILNTSNAPMTLRLFAYSDFDLADSLAPDTVLLTAPQTLVQQGKGMVLTDTIQTPTPTHWEASFYAITLDDLGSGLPVTLSDGYIPQAPGDQTYTWQWDVTLGVGQTFVINQTKSIRTTPVPLGIARSGENVVISWPANGVSGFRLYSTSRLSDEAGWSAVTNVPLASSDQYEVTLPQRRGAQSFRLRK